MASITIRDLPDKTKETLRIYAAQTGLSLESYARRILKEASQKNHLNSVNILETADKYFGAKSGVDLELPERSSHRPSLGL